MTVTLMSATPTHVFMGTAQTSSTTTYVHVIPSILEEIAKRNLIHATPIDVRITQSVSQLTVILTISVTVMDSVSKVIITISAL